MHQILHARSCDHFLSFPHTPKPRRPLKRLAFVQFCSCLLLEPIWAMVTFPVQGPSAFRHYPLLPRPFPCRALFVCPMVVEAAAKAPCPRAPANTLCAGAAAVLVAPCATHRTTPSPSQESSDPPSSYRIPPRRYRIETPAAKWLARSSDSCSTELHSSDSC